MKIVLSTDGAQPNDRYAAALLCAGALPEEVSAVRPGDPLPESFDGLLLAGGPDVDPGRYGDVATSPNLELHPRRDVLDFDLLASAGRQGAAAFGICRGLQVMNVALGGTLWQDLPSERPRGVEHDFARANGHNPAHLAHPVRPRAGRAPHSTPLSLLLATHGEILVNSRHHQAVKDLASSLVPLAASPDDLVEAFERPDGPFFAGVQWHPEDLVSRPEHKRVMEIFVEASRERAAARRPSTAPVVEVRLTGAVPVVTLNRPARGNAFDARGLRLLAATFEALANDPGVPAVVLAAAGDDFSTGADGDVIAALDLARDEAGYRDLLEAASGALLAVARFPRPVIVALDGPATGLGLSLALAADLVVAAEGVRVRPSGPETWAPDPGGLLLLAERSGPGAALELVLSEEATPAARACELRLVDVVVDAGTALAAALARATRLAERRPEAYSAARTALAAPRVARLAEAAARDAALSLDLFCGRSAAHQENR